MKEQRFEKVVETDGLDIWRFYAIFMLYAGFMIGRTMPVWSILIFIGIIGIYHWIYSRIERKVYWRKI